MKKLYAVEHYDDYWLVVASNKKQAREMIYRRQLNEEKYLARWEYENEESRERALNCGYTLEELENNMYKAGRYDEEYAKKFYVREVKVVNGYEILVREQKRKKKRK